MEERMEITPYRMGTLMNLANKVTKQMLSGAWHLTYDEMEAVLSLIQCGINESREMNEKWKSSMKEVTERSEPRAVEEIGRAHV